jgi:hypothetical protein
MAAHFLLFYALPQSELVPFGNNLRVASDAGGPLLHQEYKPQTTFSRAKFNF